MKGLISLSEDARAAAARRRRKKLTALALLIGVAVAFGMAVEHWRADHSLQEDIRQARKVMQAHPSSVVVISPEVADALDWGARTGMGDEHVKRPAVKKARR